LYILWRKRERKEQTPDKFPIISHTYFPGALEPPGAEKIVPFSSICLVSLKKMVKGRSWKSLTRKLNSAATGLPTLGTGSKRSFLLFLSKTLKLELQDSFILVPDLQLTAARAVKF
jgi:hypothetical protein